MSSSNLDQRVSDIKRAIDLAGVPVRKQFSVDMSEKQVDIEGRTARFVITTGSVDRDNDTVNPAGWDVTNYLKSPVVLWAHDYSQLPVARALELTRTATGLEALAQFPPKGVYPFADTVFELLHGGYLNATSVGFRPMEYSRDEERGGLNFLRQELLEFSIVPVPANPEALSVARAKGIDVEPVRAWAERALGDLAPTAKAVARAVIGGDTTTAASWTLNTNTGSANGKASCPSCGMEYEGTECPKCSDRKALGTCPGCGGEYDGPNPMCDDCMPKQHHRTFLKSAGLVKVQSTPKNVYGTKEPTEHLGGDDDPLRWNTGLSKAFDVADEPVEASTTELGFVARYLGCKIQNVQGSGYVVPAARMGSFLSALDERLSGWEVEALRNLTYSGREVPPAYESIQLNSKARKSFMVGGTRYMRRLSDGVKMVLKFEPYWAGLEVTDYIEADRVQVRHEFTDDVFARAGQLNFLKGEAFTLGGEFLDRGELDWPDLFLEPAKEAAMRRIVERITQQKDLMESRGAIFMGPAGTGKTLAARVMMRQADTTFIWVSARDFYRSGAFGAFTYAFDLAAECAPTILCFEDVDNWIDSQVVDLLKTEMDGMRRRRGIQTILTTNFAELLPAALIDRPGRFHDVLELGLPDEEVRGRMLSAWVPEASEAVRGQVARDTEGMSGAHIRHLTHFARTIGAEESLGLDEALGKALEKVKEQRELIASLHRSPDYRPRLTVRAAVAATKRGRVLSAANENRLRQARENLSSGVGQIDGVLMQLSTQEEEDNDDDGAADGQELAMVLAEEATLDAVVLRLAEEPSVSADEVRDVLGACVREAVGELVREQTAIALARARGRVD